MSVEIISKFARDESSKYSFQVFDCHISYIPDNQIPPPWTLIKELSLSWHAPSLHLDPISNTCNPHSSNDTFLLGLLGRNLYIITTQHHFSARMHCPAHDIYSQERILVAGCIDSIIILYKTFLLLKAVIRLSSELFPRISSLTLVPDR